ncbi:MAG: hypothetical protein VYA60_07600 [Pseudomonadota bacterium]|nr:hypothetical protein [Pseudomonadota bacterium]
MLSFSKPKMFLLSATGIVSAAFLLASITMFFQDQPSNTTFICFISALLAGLGSAVLALDIIKETKTMKVQIDIKNGLPVLLKSLDMDEPQLKDFNNRLVRKKLTNRELIAHIIHYYETRKAGNIINHETKLEIVFSEVEPLKPIIMPYSDEGDLVFDDKELYMATPDSLNRQANNEAVMSTDNTKEDVNKAG